MAGLQGNVVHWKQLGETGRLAQPALVISCTAAGQAAQALPRLGEHLRQHCRRVAAMHQQQLDGSVAREARELADLCENRRCFPRTVATNASHSTPAPQQPMHAHNECLLQANTHAHIALKPCCASLTVTMADSGTPAPSSANSSSSLSSSISSPSATRWESTRHTGSLSRIGPHLA